MAHYFKNQASISSALGQIHGRVYAPNDSHIRQVLGTIASRYVSDNPPSPPTYRAFTSAGILRGKDSRYAMDFNKLFPDAPLQAFIYTRARYHAATAATLLADISCLGPAVIMLNGREVFRSTIFYERDPAARHRIALPMKAGWNDLLLRFQKTRAGFGGIFGTWLGKHPYYLLTPGSEHAGMEGWIFSEPTFAHAVPRLNSKLAPPGGLKWHPQLGWSQKELARGQFRRILGSHPGASGIAWTSLRFPRSASGKYKIKGRSASRIIIYLDQKSIIERNSAGPFSATISATAGHHDIMVQSTCPPDANREWGFDLSLACDGQAISLKNPCAVKGTDDPWLYAGPFEPEPPVNLESLRNLSRPFPTADGESYWRLDLPETFLRPYNDNPRFGQWNYPLGVTLYGLLASAEALSSHALKTYIYSHVQFCCDTFAYALWDKQRHGGATSLHHLLTSIDSLDDCGSFGSTMLEVARQLPLHGHRRIADYVAEYISTKQSRLADGTFFRRRLMHTFHENTLWADDLYMCVPFLVRYAQLTGDARYLDDAANQFLGYKKRLFMPELKLLSHVFDFRRGLATGIPWGRGNGWALFSLTELLAALPDSHPLRPTLLAFFRELCEGLLPLQDSAGMWHQVLTHADAYPETSCTAMCTCAFARGVRHGWFENPAPYRKAALAGWRGLTQTSIDRKGNVHGVCRGSEFSFSPDYYKYDLLPILNDTHGIGIVLLAGVEVLHLLKCKPARK